MMIWHIFKKDVQLLWPLVLIAAAVHILNAIVWFILGNFTEPRGLLQLAQIFIIAVFLGVVALIVTAVHQDVLPGDRQDWLVRPIRRRDLILAKLLFVMIAVHGPILLVDLVHCMATGFTFWDSLAAALSRSVCLLFYISVPVMALATMTSTIIEVIGAILAICLIIFVFLIVSQQTSGNAGVTFATMSGGELMQELWSAVALAVAVVVIPLQYLRRATMPSRLIALGALAVIPFSILIPFAAAFSFQQWRADPVAAKAVAVAFDPDFGKIALKPGTANPANSVWVPLRVSGLAPDSIVLKDRADVRIIGHDGAIFFSGLTIGDPQTTLKAGAVPTGIDDFPVRTITDGNVETHQLIILPRKIFELVRNQSVRMEVDYALSLLHMEVSDSIAALDDDKQIANFGLCKTKMDDDGDEVSFGCLTTGIPPICATIALENTLSGQRNPSFNPCGRDYLPYKAHFVPNAMEHFGGDLPFRDLQGLAKYPVGSSQIANARITVKTYKLVAHFTRQLVIPEIRLGDWEANAPPPSP